MTKETEKIKMKQFFCHEGIKIGYATKSSYNCYFTMGMTGGTLITIDKDNNTTEIIAEF